METNGKIALFGGSFNPIHHGHLMAAEGVRQELGLSRVIFMPAAQSPHKVEGLMAEPAHRYMMVALAVSSNPYFTVSDLEIRRGGRSYSIDTVVELEKILGAGFHLLIGSDTVLEFSAWKEAEELAARCRIVVMNRPGYEFKKYFSNQLMSDTVKSSAGALLDRMEMVNIRGLDLSSSEVRELVQKGRSIKYLVPSVVEEYINKHRLYL